VSEGAVVGDQAYVRERAVVAEEAFVAAGVAVTRDVPPGAVAMGVPVRVVRSVPDADRLENRR
jgi:maltose O-acetyltransferase